VWRLGQRSGGGFVTLSLSKGDKDTLFSEGGWGDSVQGRFGNQRNAGLNGWLEVSWFLCEKLLQIVLFYIL
jgi:hypothetical protein